MNFALGSGFRRTVGWHADFEPMTFAFSKVGSGCCVLFLAGKLAGFAAGDATLVFNEVMYHPASNEGTMEWVEFHIQMAVDLDVSDRRISGEIEFTFPTGTRVPGGGYLVLSIDPAALMSATGITNLVGAFAGRLSNNGGTRPTDLLHKVHPNNGSS